MGKGWRLEELPGVMDDRDEWRERKRERERERERERSVQAARLDDDDDDGDGKFHEAGREEFEKVFANC